MCSGMTALKAAIFPLKLCRAILEGIRNQMLKDRRLESGLIGIQALLDDDTDKELMHVGDHRLKHDQKFFDDLTGQPLDPELVKKARAKELE